MDGITQALLGAVAAHSFTGRRLGRGAIAIGALGGLVPDVDVMFDAFSDPALPFELHRHFTHALVFIPVGGLIAAAPFMLLSKARAKARVVAVAATIGCATHAPLDLCTSYGTYLLWPFVNERLSWDNLSFIDPLFTLILLIGTVWALARGSIRPSAVALALSVAYGMLGVVQHVRGLAVQRTLADQRGHEIEHGRVMPTLANNVVWRSVYVADGRIHADAIRVPLWGEPRVHRGTSRPLFTVDDLRATAPSAERTRDVFTRFRRFADGFTAVVVSGESGLTFVGDMRISVEPEGFLPIWGLWIDEDDPDMPARFGGTPASVAGEDTPRGWGDMPAWIWRSITDPGPEFEPVVAAP